VSRKLSFSSRCCGTLAETGAGSLFASSAAFAASGTAKSTGHTHCQSFLMVSLRRKLKLLHSAAFEQMPFDLDQNETR
jgi:hypothetical protein